MRAQRWVSEAAFFDRLAEAQLRKVAPVDPAVLRRYAGRLRPWFHKEFRLRQRHFTLLSWFNRFVLGGHSYERASRGRKLASNVLHAVDYALLGLPGLRKMGGMAVITASLSKPT
jgi:hypothetical protein